MAHHVCKGICVSSKFKVKIQYLQESQQDGCSMKSYTNSRFLIYFSGARGPPLFSKTLPECGLNRTSCMWLPTNSRSLS